MMVTAGSVTGGRMGSGAGSERSHLETQPYETEMGGLLKPQGLPPVTHLLLQGHSSTNWGPGIRTYEPVGTF